jgi:hypothetical protein
MAPIFMFVALLLMIGVRRGEAVPESPAVAQIPVDFNPID